MFLNLLNNNEKIAFMELAYYAATANGIIDFFEKEMLDSYRKELGVEYIGEDFMTKVREIDSCLIQFKNSTAISKKAVYVELLSVCLSDKDFDISEQDFMNRIKEELSLDYSFTEKAFQWTERMMEMGKEGTSLICGEED